jgi:hypothetical protein
MFPQTKTTGIETPPVHLIHNRLTEKVLAKSKDERLKLLKAIKANISLAFLFV